MCGSRIFVSAPNEWGDLTGSGAQPFSVGVLRAPYNTLWHTCPVSIWEIETIYRIERTIITRYDYYQSNERLPYRYTVTSVEFSSQNFELFVIIFSMFSPTKNYFHFNMVLHGQPNNFFSSFTFSNRWTDSDLMIANNCNYC